MGRNAIKFVLIGLLMIGAYTLGEKQADDNWKWVLRGLEKDGAVWIVGDFELFGARSCL